MVLRSIHTARYTATQNSTLEVDDARVRTRRLAYSPLIPKPTARHGAGRDFGRYRWRPQSTGRYVYYGP
jgi:hypothetical protein